MITDQKILILTGSYGNGHLKVAKSLKGNFSKIGFNEVIESDLYLDAHPLITKVSKFLYLKSFTYGQNLYGMFYYWGKNEKKYFKEDFMSHYGENKLTNLVKTLNPDLIINTFPMLVVPQLKQKGLNIPIVNVLTDYGLHKNWVHKDVDKYYVASEKLKYDMLDLGISHDKVKVTGIPIDSKFEEAYDKQQLFKTYNLDINKPVILIAAGAFGVLKDIEQIIERILNESNNQIIVVCGNNVKLKEKLTKKWTDQKNIRILGYTNKMDELMKLAHVMVSKPGGITISEALSVQVPLILYRAVPGQERENAIFFAENRAAIHVNHPDKLINNILNIANNADIQNSMKHNMNKLYHTHAAKTICEDIITLMQNQKQKIYEATM